MSLAVWFVRSCVGVGLGESLNVPGLMLLWMHCRVLGSCAEKPNCEVGAATAELYLSGFSFVRVFEVVALDVGPRVCANRTLDDLGRRLSLMASMMIENPFDSESGF